ncbi:MAG TPA: hypothetical protein VGS21_03365 [Acidimicrobiales bacterium]|nr:hypothetical protein [Acidimicrobiales bacterium]
MTGVFVQDFKTIGGAFEDVEARVTGDPGLFFNPALRDAIDAGERMRVRVGPRSWPEALSKTVKITVNPARHVGDAVVVPFSWQADGGGSLFPHLDADLEITPAGPDETCLTLRARYQPPWGRVGRFADDVLLHRVAESTIRAFLDSVSTALASTDLPSTDLPSTGLPSTDLPSTDLPSANLP